MRGEVRERGGVGLGCSEGAGECEGEGGRATVYDDHATSSGVALRLYHCVGNVGQAPLA